MRIVIKTFALTLAWMATPTPSSVAQPPDTPAMLVITGAPGTPEFGSAFADSAHTLRDACGRAGVGCTIIGLDEAGSPAVDDRSRIESWLENAERALTQPLWIIYIGHGTWDGREARLNLRGPDLSAKELGAWLEPFKRTVIFVHGGSASGPFIPALSKTGRILITATESGDEANYARFGTRFANALAGGEADIDQDGRTSLLEAFVHAAQQAQQFYEEAGRMATEHALIDDNGDGRGTPAEWFRGTRVERKSEDGSEPDGRFAHRLALVESPTERLLTADARARRDELEQQLESLRERKASLDTDDYLRELEFILRKLSAIYAPPVDGDAGDT